MEQLIHSNPSLQKYYGALESRIGYRLLLGGTRHFGYYEPGVIWPFPINRALRRMEDHLYDSLNLQPSARVLDAGCGVGHVAIHLARKGLQVYGIDIIANHLRWARQEIQAQGLDKVVSTQLMDYHDLGGLDNNSFHGIYTMETLVHATDPDKALGEFYRVLRPGGSIALYEYDHLDRNSVSISDDLKKSIRQINKNASLPAFELFTQGALQRMLEKQGFQSVVVRDLSENVRPMFRFLFLVGYIPWLIICFLGLQAWFVNTQAGVEGYRALNSGLGRYVVVTANKPYDTSNGTHTPHRRTAV